MVEFAKKMGMPVKGKINKSDAKYIVFEVISARFFILPISSYQEFQKVFLSYASLYVNLFFIMAVILSRTASNLTLILRGMGEYLTHIVV